MEIVGSNLLLIAAALIVGKTLYEDTIVLDKITLLLMGIFTLAESVSTFFNLVAADKYTEFVLVCDCISWGTFICCFLRGGKKGFIRRFFSFIEVLFGFATSFIMFCSMVVWMVAPEWSVPNIQGDIIPREVLAVASVILVFIIFYLYFAIYRKGIFLNLKISHRLLFIAFSFFVDVFSVTVSENILNGKYMEMDLDIWGMVLISVIIMYMVFPIVLVKQRLSDYYRKGQEHHKEWLELELAHFADYEERQEETRRFRHDIVNNLSCVDALLQEEQWIEAKEYVERMLGEVKSFSSEIVTGERMLDCIVSMKQRSMKSYDIEFLLKGVLDEGLSWEPLDICAVFANALDNAVEACMRLPEDAGRWIHLTFRRTDSFYFVELANAMNVRENSGEMYKRFTTKKNKEFHGYGMESIRRTLEKYGGSMQTEMEKSKFILSMMIPVSDAAIL